MNSSRGSANLVMRCKFCKRDLTARKFQLSKTLFRISFDTFSVEFEPSFKIRKYDAEQNGKFQQIAQFDCRGLELIDFQPRVRGYKSNTLSIRCSYTMTLGFLDRQGHRIWHSFRRNRSL